MLSTLDCDEKAYRSARLGKSYRGEIWQNAQRFKLIGRAFESLPADQNGHFNIRSARQLEGPLRALRDPNVRIVIIIGAVQVLKSVAGDIWVPYILEHDLRNMLVLFETNEKADAYCSTRFMDTIRQHPVLKQLLAKVERWDITKTEIKVSGATLRVGGMNDSNTSSLSWPLIWVSEAWQHKSDGLLRKAIKRADRFPNDCKILIESQAGLKGEDLFRECEAAHAVPLTWACPLCQGRQTWQFSRLRPSDHPNEKLRGTYAGMSIPADGTIQERAAKAEWECYHCGGKIADTKDNRQAIMDSYEQDYQIATITGEKVSPQVVAFYIPKEAARDNSFEKSASAFLVAKQAQESGNMTPLQDWYMAERAEFYDIQLSSPQVTTVMGGYDPNQQIENEHHRGLIIDCQKDLINDTVGTFWYEAYAVDKNGNSYQLERGFAKTWDAWLAVQKKWSIRNSFVCVDGRKWTPEILQKAAEYRQMETGIHPLTRQPVTFWSTWRIFLGDAPARHYRHADGRYRVWSPPTPTEQWITNPQGKRERVIVFMYRWSNISVKDQLHTLRIGGEGKPKFVALKREQLTPENQLKERDDYTYENQMSSEIRTEKNGKSTWEKMGMRPNHYWDTACMRIVRIAQESLLGHIAPTEPT